MRLKPEQRIIVVGQTGSGKTYWTNTSLVSDHDTVAIFDPHKNYSVGYYESFDKVWKGARKWGVSVPFKDAKSYKQEFEKFVDGAMQRKVDLIVVDELALLRMQRFDATFSLIKLATQARHSGSACAFVDQRLMGVGVALRSQCSHIISFQQVDDYDCRATAKAMHDAKITPSSFAGLKRGQYILSQIR